MTGPGLVAGSCLLESYRKALVNEPR